MSERNRVVDITKGIGILLVILGHIVNNVNIECLIYMFHMPLFFFLSGVTFKYLNVKECSFKKYFVKKLKSIMIPYFIFSILCFFYWWIIERNLRHQFDVSILSNFINIFTCFINGDLYAPNIVMWFLPCLLISQLLFYFIVKVDSEKTKILIVLICFILGLFLNHYGIILPYGIETVFIAIFFIYFGSIFSINKVKFNKKSAIILFFSIIGMIICYFFDYRLNMLGHCYGNPLLFIISSFSGIYVIIYVSELFNKYSQKLSYISAYLGKNSLILMMCHEPIKRVNIIIFSKMLGLSSVVIRQNIIFSFVLTIITIVTLIPFIFLIKKYFPWLLGKKIYKENVA